MKQLIQKYRWAFWLTTLCLLKLAFRAIYIGNLHLFFLIWNLFLAFVPYVMSYYVLSHINQFQNKWKLGGVFIIWLLFLPNAFYVFTDFIHLRLSTNQTFLVDFFTILSFATTAWWFGLKSILHFKSIIVNHFQKKWFEIYDYILPFLMALGVYMGRFDRFNSWDILTRPHDIVWTAFNHTTNIQILVICLFYGFLIHITSPKAPKPPTPEGGVKKAS